MKQRAYTLIELLVVISIMALLLAAGVPAFRSMNDKSNFADKVEEITAMMNQTNILALNPENSEVANYQLVFDSQKVTLRKNGVTSSDIKAIDLGVNKEYFNSPDKITFICYTNRNKSCDISNNGNKLDMSPVELVDPNVPAAKARAQFNVRSYPYNVSVSYISRN
ncbi:MAG: type II secretion system protein [Candidatus Berkelbacteria bacterium]|nr:type II secretion system protein [Candidatus Berkelbacteria bacterium]